MDGSPTWLVIHFQNWKRVSVLKLITEHLTWISKLLTTALVACPSSLTINTQIYVTGAKGALPDVNSLGQNDTDSVSGTPSVSDEEKKPELALSIKTNQGRPDIHQILEEATCSASGPVSVDGDYSVRYLYLTLTNELLSQSRWTFSPCSISSIFLELQPD